MLWVTLLGVISGACTLCSARNLIPQLQRTVLFAETVLFLIIAMFLFPSYLNRVAAFKAFHAANTNSHQSGEAGGTCTNASSARASLS